jgi:hypothetical protein
MGFLGGLEATTFTYGIIKCEGSLLQKLLDDIFIKETFNYLVPECLLKTVVGTEVARLGELTKGNQVVIKGFPLSEVAPLYSFVDPAIHIGSQGGKSLGWILPLGCGEPKVLHNSGGSRGVLRVRTNPPLELTKHLQGLQELGACTHKVEESIQPALGLQSQLISAPPPSECSPAPK